MPTNHRKWLRNLFRAWPLGVAAILIACLPMVRAGAVGNDFNIQVSPSPLLVTLTPGQTQTATLTVRNFSNHSESLVPSLSGVRTNGDGNNVSLTDVVPADMRSWVQFTPAAMTIGAGQSAELTIAYHTPQNVGFSYSVAISLTSTRAAAQTSTGTAIKPQIVVFCLININRSDAKSELSIEGITSGKARYAFLPADFSVRIHNGGNIISQPSGTIFIQRAFGDTKPIATIPVNKGGGYVLPGTSRNFGATWTSGFPVYATDANGKRHLSWDWRHIGELRLGRYVAKAVLVYDNGHQDVPIVLSTTFWVVPWWLIFLVIFLVIALVMGVITWGRLIFAGTKKVRSYAAHHKK